MSFPAKFGGKCEKCGEWIPAGSSVNFDASTRTIRHAPSCKAGKEQAAEIKAQPKKDEVLDPTAAKIIGRAQYKGHDYLLLWEGVTSRGTQAARMAFRDGSKMFWADAGTYSVTKRYQDAISLNKLNRLAAEYKEREKDHSKPAETVMAADMMARASELAEKAGVQIIGTEPTKKVADEKVSLGETRKVKGGWVVVVGLGKYDKYYQSQDDLEDRDDFTSRPGWQESQEYWGVECGEPATVTAAREKKEAEVKAKADAIAAEKAAWEIAKAQIPADYKTRHGAMYGGEVIMNGERFSEPGLSTQQLPWTKLAESISRVDDPASSIHGRVQDSETLYGALLGDGRPIFRIAHYSGFGDDLRETHYFPVDIWTAILTAEVRSRGITPEAAREWLGQYRGCVGTELYEFAAEMKVSQKKMEMVR